MSFNFKNRTEGSIKAWYEAKQRAGKNGFASYTEFISWYNQQHKVCNYCGLSENESQLIVVSGLLTSKRFPKDGINSRGTSRGMWLEIDKVDPTGLYSADNCVVCCYFCNNDKSDVMNGEQYRSFRENRIGFLKELLDKHHNEHEQHSL